MYWYRIKVVRGKRIDLYYPQYKRGVNGNWKDYSRDVKASWEAAYKELEKHANPAALAVRFVGTF